jgi:hypothetical protein
MTDGGAKHSFRFVQAKRRALPKKWQSSDASLKSPARPRATRTCRYMCVVLENSVRSRPLVTAMH